MLNEMIEMKTLITHFRKELLQNLSDDSEKRYYFKGKDFFLTVDELNSLDIALEFAMKYLEKKKKDSLLKRLGDYCAYNVQNNRCQDCPIADELQFEQKDDYVPNCDFLELHYLSKEQINRIIEILKEWENENEE